MAANTTPIFTGTPSISFTNIPTTSICTASLLAASVISASVYPAFTAGVNGSYVSKARFMSTATTASITSIATTLRLFYSTTSSGATCSYANTACIAEVSVPAVVTAVSTIGVPYYDVQLNLAMPSGSYLLVGQHVAQTTNQSWNCIVFGGNY